MSVSTRSTGNIIPAIQSYSGYVTLHKKGGNQHKIPYSMTCIYVHPPIDNVRSEYQVDVPMDFEGTVEKVKWVEEAIEVYLQAFNQKFQSKEGKRHRKRSLEMFLQYLAKQGHSLKLKDLTPAEGKGFLDSLTNHYDGMLLKAASKAKHWNAIRSFSRFLQQMGIIGENIFLTLKKQ